MYSTLLVPVIFAQNVSAEKRHKKRRKTKQAAEKRPEPRQYRNREQEIIQWQNRVVYFETKMSQNKKLGSTWITGQSHSSKSPIDALQPIRLRDMMVPMLHTGRYLICRTLGKAIGLVGVSVLVEDLNGDVEDLSLYNFRYDLSDTSWIPPGSIMVVKEPYLKASAAQCSLHIPQCNMVVHKQYLKCYNCGALLGTNISIRVDSPSDVEFVEKSDYKRLEYFGALKWYKEDRLDFNQLKSEGNYHYGRKNFETALKYYNKALLLDPNSAVIHLNKAAALLPLEKFYEAYNEAKTALEGDANAEKSLYRLGMAAYGMRQWDKAAGHFRDLLNRSPDHEEAKAELQRTMARINESRTGKYDVHDLYNKTVKGNIRRLDIADYTGPVQVVDVPKKGKGLVATDDISKGTLILASKAFAAAFDEDCDGILYSCSMILKDTDDKTCLLNMIKTIEHLQKNPQLANELYSLYAGDMQRDQEIPSGVIDTARIQHICSYNRVSTTNEIDMLITEELTSQRAEDHKFNSPTGLWILPSFINHSCIENANRIFYGDFMMLFAVQHIAKGEEITLTYANPFDSYEKRKEKLAKYYGFQCDCHLCHLDRADHMFLAKRRRLVSECKKLFGSPEHIENISQHTVSRLVSLTKQIRQTYKNRSEYRLDLFEPLSMLGTLYEMKHDYRNGVKYFEEVLKCLGEGLRHTFGPKALIHLAQNYLVLGEYQRAQQFRRQAMDICKMKMGANDELFKELFSGLPEIL